MYDLEYEIRSKCTNWSKKLDRNVRLCVRNLIEMYDLVYEISSNCTSRSEKLERNVRLGVRN